MDSLYWFTFVSILVYIELSERSVDCQEIQRNRPSTQIVGGINKKFYNYPECPSAVMNPDGSGGYITSNEYPDNYSSYSACSYVIEARSDQVIEAYFASNFSLEPSTGCVYDFVELRDGPFGYSTLLVHECGLYSPPGIWKSTTNYLWLGFFSDDVFELKGFKLMFRFSTNDVNSKERKKYRKAVNKECFVKLSPTVQGRITTRDIELAVLNTNSINNRQKSEPGELLALSEVGYFDCTFHLKVPGGHMMSIDFTTVTMSLGSGCTDNRMVIYKGMSIPKFVEREFCSDKSQEVTIDSDNVFLRFSGQGSSGKGQYIVEAIYTAFRAAPCRITEIECDMICFNDKILCRNQSDQECFETITSEDACQRIKGQYVASNLTIVQRILGTLSETSGAVWLLLLLLAMIILLAGFVLTYTFCCYPLHQTRKRRHYKTVSEKITPHSVESCASPIYGRKKRVNNFCQRTNPRKQQPASHPSKLIHSQTENCGTSRNPQAVTGNFNSLISSPVKTSQPGSSSPISSLPPPPNKGIMKKYGHYDQPFTGELISPARSPCYLSGPSSSRSYPSTFQHEINST